MLTSHDVPETISYQTPPSGAASAPRLTVPRAWSGGPQLTIEYLRPARFVCARQFVLTVVEYNKDESWKKNIFLNR